jgi:hypothetical protein
MIDPDFLFSQAIYISSANTGSLDDKISAGLKKQFLQMWVC